MSEQSHRLKEEQFSLSVVYFPQIVTKFKIFLCFLHLSILSHFFFFKFSVFTKLISTNSWWELDERIDTVSIFSSNSR